MLPMTGMTRRSLLASLTAVTTGSFVWKPASAAHSLANELWRRRTDLIAARRKTSESMAAAILALPKWAAPGPLFRHRDGSYSGGTVDHPEIRGSLDWPQNQPFLLVRPNLSFLNFQHRQAVSAFGREKADFDLAQSQHRLERRIDGQRVEWERVGLPALKAESERLLDEIKLVGSQIRLLSLDNKNSTAANILLEMCQAHNSADLTFQVSDGDYRLAILALRSIEYELDGQLRIDVGRVLSREGVPLREMPWWVRA